jgi:hypothetical protein
MARQFGSLSNADRNRASPENFPHEPELASLPDPTLCGSPHRDPIVSVDHCRIVGRSDRCSRRGIGWAGGLKDRFLLFVGPAAYYKGLPTGPTVIH